LHHPIHDHDHGLTADIETLIRQSAQRRHALRRLLGGAAASLGLAACGGGSETGSTASTGDTDGSTNTGSCSPIPEETAGPYPGDGSNSSNGGVANALMLSGIVRSDIRSSIAGASGTAAGVPLTVQLQLVNSNNACASLAGFAIYLWHCDALGRYSMYSSGVTAQNYLRGVQVTDSSGFASFITVFPGCYSGRMPHMHFEIYRSSSTATSFSNKLKTSQLALPVASCQQVYATSAYTGSTANLAAISFASDNVFSDGVTTQLASISGNVNDGFVATLQVGISV
jgi:protocatechuate 3,4-dioxygenase beta subunit